VTVLLGPLVGGKLVTVLFGAKVVGIVVGALVGTEVGAVVGEVVGAAVVGAAVVGAAVVGAVVGAAVVGAAVVGAAVVGAAVVGAAVVGAPVVGAAVDEKFQSQVPDSSPTAAIANLFSLKTLALSSGALPVIIPCRVATGELKILAFLLYPLFE